MQAILLSLLVVVALVLLFLANNKKICYRNKVLFIHSAIWKKNISVSEITEIEYCRNKDGAPFMLNSENANSGAVVVWKNKRYPLIEKHIDTFNDADWQLLNQIQADNSAVKMDPLLTSARRTMSEQPKTDR